MRHGGRLAGSISGNDGGRTGLRDRLHFFSNAPLAYLDAVKHGERGCVAMLDIDFFKKVNDTHGHQAGDAVLRHVASRLAAHAGKTGFLARLGGEEFCFYGRGMDGEQAARLFNELRVDVQRSPVAYDGHTINVTLSSGIARLPRRSIDEAVNRADELLYEAKKGGRNRVVVEAL